jgi:hypothetical protein
VNHEEIWHEDVNWIHLPQEVDQWWALMNTVINLKVGNFLITLAAITFSRILLHGAVT